MFIKLENGEPVGNPLIQENMQYLFPNFNFNQVVTPSMIEPMGYGIYEFSQQPTLERYKKLSEGTPIKNLNNGIYYQNWQIVDKTAEECALEDQQQEESVRRQRNGRLFMTDWTQVADSPLSSEKKLEYQTYRTVLRNVPSQEGFPWSVIWPVEPT